MKRAFSVVAFLTVASILGLCGRGAHAALIVSEGFDILPGELTGTSGVTSTGWQGNWSGPVAGREGSGQVVIGSLIRPVGTESFFPEPIGNSASLHGLVSNSNGTVANIAPATSLWGSFLAQPAAVGFQQFFIRFGGPFDNLTLQFGRFGTSDHWSVSNGAGANLDTGNSFADGVDAIVFELALDNTSRANDVLRVWFDADPSTAPPTFTTSAVNFGASGSGVLFEMGYSNNFYDESTLLFDELRVGTALSDVTTVPEPSALLFLSIGAVALAFTRIRNR